ncbi:hypothetical protein B0H63DRAFT_510651 [Podospora didyma]|uniref:Ankyrin n=1 Tax=Podospora didyma TaxID=330526 RepID=A0AAE0NQW2_9PEZI|nr:hypothetical protein B0H63DRAFT_510651 [Podospora didyma]
MDHQIQARALCRLMLQHAGFPRGRSFDGIGGRLADRVMVVHRGNKSINSKDVFPILGLPTEIIVMIGELDQDTMAKLARTNRHLHQVLNHHLYVNNVVHLKSSGLVRTVRDGNLPALYRFLSVGANPNITTPTVVRQPRMSEIIFIYERLREEHSDCTDSILEMAIKSGMVHAAKALILAGANVFEELPMDKVVPPSTAAIYLMDRGMVRAPYVVASMNHFELAKYTASLVTIALFRGDADMATMLLDNGFCDGAHHPIIFLPSAADDGHNTASNIFYDSDNDNGNNTNANPAVKVERKSIDCLSFACTLREKPEMAKLLLARPDTDPNARDSQGLVPLFWALYPQSLVNKRSLPQNNPSFTLLDMNLIVHILTDLVIAGADPDISVTLPGDFIDPSLRGQTRTIRQLATIASHHDLCVRQFFDLLPEDKDERVQHLSEDGKWMALNSVDRIMDRHFHHVHAIYGRESVTKGTLGGQRHAMMGSDEQGLLRMAMGIGALAERAARLKKDKEERKAKEAQQQAE